MFYCDPTAADWQRQQYEHFHAAVTALHERFAVPYAYVEWRAALAYVGPVGRPLSPPAPEPRLRVL